MPNAASLERAWARAGIMFRVQMGLDEPRRVVFWVGEDGKKTLSGPDFCITRVQPNGCSDAEGGVL